MSANEPLAELALAVLRQYEAEARTWAGTDDDELVRANEAGRALAYRVAQQTIARVFGLDAGYGSPDGHAAAEGPAAGETAG